MAVNAIPQKLPFTADFKESLLKIPEGDRIQAMCVLQRRLSIWLCHGLPSRQNDRLDAGWHP